MISEYLAEQIKKYFVGKICSILTHPIGMELDNKTFPQWFTVLIEDVDTEAILGTDINRNTKILYFFPILGIAEEQHFGPDHPNYETIKNQATEILDKMKNRTATPDENLQMQHQSMSGCNEGSAVLPLDDLQKQASELKKKWSTSSNVQR